VNTADMAAALALVSSCREKPFPAQMAAFGEVGLAGEVRAVDMPRQRAAEAAKFGFTRCILPKGCAGGLEDAGLDCLYAGALIEAIEQAVEE